MRRTRTESEPASDRRSSRRSVRGQCHLGPFCHPAKRSWFAGWRVTDVAEPCPRAVIEDPDGPVRVERAEDVKFDPTRPPPSVVESQAMGDLIVGADQVMQALRPRGASETG